VLECSREDAEQSLGGRAGGNSEADPAAEPRTAQRTEEGAVGHPGLPTRPDQERGGQDEATLPGLLLSHGFDDGAEADRQLLARHRRRDSRCCTPERALSWAVLKAAGALYIVLHISVAAILDWDRAVWPAGALAVLVLARAGAALVARARAAAPKCCTAHVSAARCRVLALAPCAGLLVAKALARPERAPALLGLAACVAASLAASTAPRAVRWDTVAAGLAMQVALGCLVLQTRVGQVRAPTSSPATGTAFPAPPLCLLHFLCALLHFLCALLHFLCALLRQSCTHTGRQ
jgi:hypothetical protein